MSELELLFLALALIYCWECACWLRRGSVAARTWIGRRWRPAHPGTLLGNQHGGFVFASVLPPLGNLVTANQFPLSLSPDAALAYVSSAVNPGGRPPQSGRSVRFDQMQTLAVRGRKLQINGATFLKCPTPAFARFLLKHLGRLQKAVPAERAKVIEKITRESFDAKAIERRWQEFRKRIRPLRWLTNALFVYLFAAVPLVVRFAGFKRSWLELLIGLLALTTATALGFRRVHRALYPDAEDERLTHFLTILLSPAAAVRTQDVLSRPLLETFHPLAVIRVFCPPAAFQQYAETVLREVRFPALPLAPTGEAGAESVEHFSRGLLQKTLETFLLENKVDPDELNRPPVPADETCQAYCPRCRVQFMTSDAKCDDCGGRPLIAFARGPTQLRK